jgi:hypothetical protein
LSKYYENVIERFQLMFPFYVFEHWWELLQGQKRYGRKPYRAEGIRRVPGLPAPVPPIQGGEVVLRALERMRVIPISLDCHTVWERARKVELSPSLGTSWRS